MTSLSPEEQAEWRGLTASITKMLEEMDITGCPRILHRHKQDPKTYRFMTAALSRSYVMARRTMLQQAQNDRDIDKLRVYHKFFNDPHIDPQDIDLVMHAMRIAGGPDISAAITSDHFSRYYALKAEVPDVLRGRLDWSDSSMDIVYAAYVTGTDDERRLIISDVEATLSMIRERGVIHFEEYKYLLQGSESGSVALSSGAL